MKLSSLGISKADFIQLDGGDIFSGVIDTESASISDEPFEDPNSSPVLGS